MNQQQDSEPTRHYPRSYEKAVPIALGIIVLTTILLLLLIFAVAFGFAPGGG